MGPEARFETAAARLVCAVGYLANEDYFLPVLHVEQMTRLRPGEISSRRETTCITFV